MKTFIDEKQVENLQEAADLADGYFLTHGSYNQQRNQSSDKQHTANISSGVQLWSYNQQRNQSSDKQHTANISSGSDVSQQPMNSTQSIEPNSEMAVPICNYCKRRGHLRSECFYLTGKQPSTHDVQQPSPSGHIVPMQLVSDPPSAAIMP